MSASHPRIAFTGNIGNTHFAVVEALRAVGIDAHMFVGTDDPLAWRPETDKPSLRGAYPDWIHEGRWFTARHAASPWRAPLVAALADFDMVIASGSTPAFVQFAGRPWAFFATGGDITVRPFPWTFRSRRGGLVGQAGHAIVSAWQRRALRRADQVWIQPFAPFVDATDRLGIGPDRISESYFPLIMDTDTFRPQPDIRERGAPWVDDMCADADFVVFSPTRLVFGDTPELRRSGQWKGSQVLLDAFAEFVRRGIVERPVLALPDWVLSDDVAEAKTRVAQMGLTEHVRFLAPPRPDGFNRSEIADLHAAADVVVDEFGSGWFGFVSLEAMACATPVVSRIDLPAITKMYGDDWPWLNADGAPEAADHFAALATSPSRASQVGAASCEWIERHHSPCAARDRYVAAVSRSLDLLVA